MDNDILDEPKQCPDFRGTAMGPHKGASHCAHLQGCQIPVRRKPVSLFGWNCPCEVWVSVQVFKPFSTRAVLVRLWSPPCSLCHLPPSTASLWISASTWNAALSSKAMLRGTWPSAFLQSMAAQTDSTWTFQVGAGWILCNLFSLHFWDGVTGEVSAYMSKSQD